MAKNVIRANGNVANVAPIQTHRPDIRPGNVVRVHQLHERRKRLTINELVLSYFVPSVPDGTGFLEIVNSICSRQEHGEPQKETRDREGQKKKGPY